jgi:hypothetical protein
MMMQETNDLQVIGKLKQTNDSIPLITSDLSLAQRCAESEEYCGAAN